MLMVKSVLTKGFGSESGTREKQGEIAQLVITPIRSNPFLQPFYEIIFIPAINFAKRLSLL